MAYFQQGVSNFLIGDFEEALANFNDTLLYLRGNTYIDYDQLGLKFKLYSCEVLFNRGLCYMYMQQKEEGLQDFSYASKEKVVDDHDVIDEAIRDEAEVRVILLPTHRGRLGDVADAGKAGLYRLLHSGRGRLPTEQRQGQEPEDQGLSRQGASGRGDDSQQCIYRIYRSGSQDGIPPCSATTLLRPDV